MLLANLEDDETFFAQCEKLGYARKDVQEAVRIEEAMRGTGSTSSPEARAAILDALETIERWMANDDPPEKRGLVKGFRERLGGAI